MKLDDNYQLKTDLKVGKELIQEVVLNSQSQLKYKKQFVGAIILTRDNKILLQQRGDNCYTHPGCISEFGGKIEPGESPIQALLRELAEELGAKANESDVVHIGVITEKCTNYSELIYAYFWHDKFGSITGCYEDEAKYFNTVSEAYEQLKLMDSARWMLHECQAMALVI